MGGGGPLLGRFSPTPPRSCIPPSGWDEDMKMNFPVSSLEGKAWIGLGAPGKAELPPSCLGGQDGQWPRVVWAWVLKDG